MSSRINVYVHAALKKRMDKVKDVSWSQVACEAFERRLGEIAARKEDKKMDDVIQRLRASKIECDKEEAEDGQAHGQDWAKHHATAKQLKRLDKFMSRWDSEPYDAFEAVNPDHEWSAAYDFVNTINGKDPHGDDRDHARAAEEFWQELGWEDDTPDDEYVQAFADAARSVWHEVAGQI